MITAKTSLLEVAAFVSQALIDAGIKAVLSGGGAVSTYTHNRYESADLDFVCSAETKRIEKAIAHLGFKRGDKWHTRYFEHPEARWLLEFPPGPVSFGGTRVDSDQDFERIDTQRGTLIIITPTQCVMDRLAAYIHWSDQQSFDQAILVARNHPVEWHLLEKWAVEEGITPKRFEYFRAQVHRQ